jgi:hypothetical protein
MIDFDEAAKDRCELCQVAGATEVAICLAIRQAQWLRSPLVFFNFKIRLDFRCGEIDRVFKLVSARLAGPYVPNTALGPMLRPLWCNDSSTTLRTLDDWTVIHGDLLSPSHEKRCPKNRARLRNRDQLLLRSCQTIAQRPTWRSCRGWRASRELLRAVGASRQLFVLKSRVSSDQTYYTEGMG